MDHQFEWAILCHIFPYPLGAVRGYTAIIMQNILRVIVSLSTVLSFVVIDAKPWCGNYGCDGAYGGGSNANGGNGGYGGSRVGFGASGGGGPPSYNGGFAGGRFGGQGGGEMSFGAGRQNFDINAWLGGFGGGQQGRGGRRPDYVDQSEEEVEEDEYSDYTFQPRVCRGCRINNIGNGRYNKNSFHLHRI